ncbi:MAG: FAD synthase [Candidatus Woesearchaeota archaeon]|jgi:FAD synthetase|nr:FAD synthase [Candidatus Woesearchaeota archaeon]MDP6265957.1 FAD synthase [Candidatus Woesearchaeota archaeon]MDP7322723.1 FAD synthase [Candidatus Woesearchaeota archaeon]HJO01688.1 adenylyltransferase/cytidyltransferase family protein [Candidatus Woesearchaeota archaeon]|tara:strand:- start:978 stop:1379 length:402 start_codon:yes stop_codon:yes gene_type:complete
MKKVMAFGSFDMLHKGHEAYLKEAKSYGDYLIVIVARDESIIRFKGRKPKNDENSRLGQIKKLDFVDEAVLGSKGNIFDVLEEYSPDVICLGYDQKTVEEEKLREELEKRNLKAKIVRAKPYKEDIYKSSKLK